MDFSNGSNPTRHFSNDIGSSDHLQLTRDTHSGSSKMQLDQRPCFPLFTFSICALLEPSVRLTISISRTVSHALITLKAKLHRQSKTSAIQRITVPASSKRSSQVGERVAVCSLSERGDSSASPTNIFLDSQLCTYQGQRYSRCRKA